MVTYHTSIYHSGHFEMCRNIESLHCRSIILQKQIHRKRDQICGYQRQGVEGGELDESSQKEQTFSYKINKY